MSNKEFQLEIITPEKVVFSEKVVIVTAPGKDGYLGILANHAPLLTSGDGHGATSNYFYPYNGQFYLEG